MIPEKQPTRQELEARIHELEQALSECKIDKKSLPEGNRGYRELLSRLPIGVYRNTPGRNGRFIMANEAIAKMFGYESSKEFMKAHVAELYVDPSEREEFSQRLLSNDSVENAVLCLKKRDGSQFWGSVTATVVRNDQGAVDFFEGIIQDITEQRKAIEEKEIARRLLQSVLDAVPDLLIVIDRDFKIQYTNYKGHDLIKPPEGDLSLTCYGRFKKLDAPCDDCSADPVFSEGRTVDREMVNPADGRIREVRAFPIYNTGGSVEYAVEYVRDITERKHTEDALRISEDRLSKIMRAANDGMWDWDLKTNNVLFDPRYYEMAGYTVDEFPHRLEAFQERVHPEDIDEVMAQAEKHLKGEIERFQVEFRFRRKSGKWMWIAGRGIIVERDDEGMPTRFVGTHQDITERKHAIEAMKESEKRFRDLVALLPIAVFETDINMKLTFANLFAFEIFGYSEADLANGINGLDLIAPSDHERVMSNFTKRFKGEDPGTVEYQAITKDGSTFPMLLRAASIVKDGELHGIRGVIVDITDRKQAEMERERLQSQIRQAQKMEAIGTLAGGIAHDFNNLLMGIQGRASLMSFDLKSSHPCHEHVSAIMDYSRSASDLTKQLLGVARGGKFEVKPMDLNEILSSSAAMFGRTKKEIRIHTKLHNPTPVVMIDRMQIEQVLLNLFVNAWQAMPQSGELYLETSIVPLDEIFCKPYSVTPGTYAKISVTDTGVGMDEAILPRIFDPFFSTKEKERGTGLGLASAYGIVKNHGGIVTVYSEVGHGTTFNIYLPLSDKTAEKREAPTSAFIKGTETILLIDDEQMITEVGQTMLEKLGYRVVVANNGKDGIAIVNEKGADIDLVILDMIMPGMDGGQTFDRLKEIHSTIPVILSSGYSLNGQAEKIIDRGCSGFIQKPFDLETLSRKVHEVMNQGKSDDQG